MDARHFDAFVKGLASPVSRRRLLAVLATLPLLGSSLDILGPAETEAKERRRRRKQRHRRHKNPGNRKEGCKPKSTATVCAGKCGEVKNRQTCGKTVNCGTCDCNPPCDECFTCQGAAGAVGSCLPQAGAPCGEGSLCQDGVRQPQGSCDGGGVCVPAEPVSCTPYTQCDGNACATTCTSDDHCVADSYCDQEGRCVGDGTFGLPCAHDGQCSSGFCADNVCCENACKAVCFACDVPGNLGACIPDPAEEGAPCGAAGQICQADGACMCDAVSCTNPTPICANGECVSCTSSDQCASGEVCEQGSCQSCTPVTCQSLGRNCGTYPDGCGGTVQCGTCGTGQVCAPPGNCASSCTPNVSVCGGGCGCLHRFGSGSSNDGVCAAQPTACASSGCDSCGAGSVCVDSITTCSDNPACAPACTV